MATGSGGMYAAAPQRAPAQPGHVGLGSAFIDEYKPRRVQSTLEPPPLLACLQDIGAVLLAGAERLFLYVSSIEAKA